jgi:flagellar hook-associated protein 1 FlgK
MSLFGTIQQSSGALQAAQIGLQVVGNNIANTNTPGYIRQDLQQASAIGTRQGALVVGHGVRPIGITQSVDKALAERMFSAKNALAGAETLERAYGQLEELTTDLNNDGLGSQLTLFNNSLHELSAQPGDPSLRDFVILQGENLAASIQRNREESLSQRDSWNVELDELANEVNRLTERIADLNLNIATVEGGGLSHNDATGLRDQRLLDLESLAELVDINIQEQESGAVAVFVGGDYLVSNGNSREVYTAYSNSLDGTEIRIVETDSPLAPSRGEVASVMAARDGVFGEHVRSLDEMAAGLIRSMNEVHTQGQGRRGYREIVSTETAVPGVPLVDSGLPVLPRNGTFDMNLVDDNGDVITNHRISVRRLGQVGDSTINSIAAEIDAIDGVSANLSADGQLQIVSDSPTAQFTFGEDTSGFLASMGINTFFTGSSAVDIQVNQAIRDDADLFAISTGGIGEDTAALTEMIDIVDRPLDLLNGRSVRQRYERSVADLGQEIALQNSTTEGLRNFYATLQSQHLAITGVNIDEESIKMVAYQRAFQASSRVISTASEMLEILVNL